MLDAITLTPAAMDAPQALAPAACGACTCLDEVAPPAAHSADNMLTRLGCLYCLLRQVLPAAHNGDEGPAPASMSWSLQSKRLENAKYTDLSTSTSTMHGHVSDGN